MEITASKHPNSLITKGFYATALYNILAFFIFSKLLTNDYLASLDPQVFSKLGWVSIFLWGLACWSVSKSYHHVPKLIFVFFIEKMVYTSMWIYWLAKNGSQLPEFSTGIFNRNRSFNIWCRRPDFRNILPLGCIKI